MKNSFKKGKTMKKTIVTLFCCALSVSTFAATDGLPANYTITSTDIEPTDVIGELNDDPEQPAVPTSTEVTTMNTEQINKYTGTRSEWKSRKDSALKRRKSDPSLK
jgi:hypothetical protein